MRVVKPPEERRHEIVTAATELFLKNGYDNTSMNDVMRTLGIAKGTIYHYFTSKEQLMEAVVDHLAGEYAEHRRSRVDATEGNALDKLRVLFAPGEDAARNMAASERLHESGNVKLHTRLLGALVERLAPIFGELIDQGCREGLFETEHPTEVAELLLAGIQYLTDQGFFPWEGAVVARRVAAFPPIIESLLRAEHGSFTFLFQSENTSEGSDT